MKPVLVLVALPLLLVGCSAQRFTTHGSLTLTSKSILGADGAAPSSRRPCSGTAGVSALTAGAQVTVVDAAGTTIALGHLDPGKYDRGRCTFTFAVPEIPAGLDIYGVAVGERDGRQFTRDEMRAGPSLDVTYTKQFWDF